MNPTSSFTYVGVMLLAGMCIPVMAAMSGGIGVRVGNPSFAIATTFALAFVICAISAAIIGMPRLSQIVAIPPWLYLGGLCVAFYGLAITFVGPRFGLANAIFCVLVGQIVAAALIDHFGLFGTPQAKLDGTRLLGMAVMVGGLFLAKK
ncbi:MAG: DMT family transporter [Candidatus Andeanibacterium colombiense]|uniref:DMT family transporter n=1 Tax=Candidatus Andeanibacterium colombiense TaxID=3121345 RepID=A0AAJ5X4W8_9SPHN|nr:MAG: DMT family transporter [Sphingomonadaceae bacterium]